MTQVLRRALPSEQTDRLAVATLRSLTAEAAPSCASAPGVAPLAWTLWSRHLRHDPADPGWADRDRFVLATENGPALLGGLLHLFGYDLDRPGHRGPDPRALERAPESGCGLATAVGMALAERMIRARCPEITDHRTYAILSTCPLEESGQVAELAARLGLGRLIALWSASGTELDDERLAWFAARGWHVQSVLDGGDVEEIDRALSRAEAAPRPSLVAVRSATDDHHPVDEVPEEVRELCEAFRHIGRAEHAVWLAEFDAFRKSFPERAAAFQRTRAQLPAGLAERLGARTHDHLPAPAERDKPLEPRGIAHPNPPAPQPLSASPAHARARNSRRKRAGGVPHAEVNAR